MAEICHLNRELLQSLYDKLNGGVFYENHDEDMTLVGQLLLALAATPKTPRLAIMAVAQQVVDALEADRKSEGYDLEAGMFGPAFSNLMRKWAALEYAAQPAKGRSTYGTEAEGDAYTLGWFEGQGWGFPTHELESAVTAEQCTWMVKEIDTLRNALMLAYGHLWHTNNEPMAPTRMRSAEKAAYEARKVLREMLTHEQRGTAINRVQEMLNNEFTPSSPLTEDDMGSRFQSGRATDEQDTARLDWVLPIITGEDDAIANNRTIALAGCLAHGRNGRETIDLARKVVG